MEYSFGMSFLQTIASITSFGMLLEVTYPTQLIVTCALPIPVMIGYLLARRRCYSIQRYIFVAAIAVGVVLFVINSTLTDAGLYIMFTNLGASSILIEIQEMARRETAMTHLDTIYATHLGITALLGIGLCASFRGEDPAGIIEFLRFSEKFPQTIYLIGLLALVYALGQLCMYYIFSTSGNEYIPYSMVLALRKLSSLLFSVFVFQNPLITMQWIGVAVLLMAMIADVLFGRFNCTSNQETNNMEFTVNASGTLKSEPSHLSGNQRA